MTERRQFYTKDFIDISGEKRSAEGSSKCIEIDSNRWARMRSWRDIDTCELKWANAIFIDLERGLSFYYDHDFWAEPFRGMGLDRQYKPYRAVISFVSASMYEDGERVSQSVPYGTFHYDKTGVLRVIQGEHFTTDRYAVGVPSACFLQRENGTWEIIKKENKVEVFSGFIATPNITTPQYQTMKTGEEVVIDEILSCITTEDNRTQLHQRTLLGHKQKKIVVPSSVNIEEWRAILGSEDKSWANILSRYPSDFFLEV